MDEKVVIKEAVKDGKLVIGKDTVVKMLKTKSLKTVLLANNSDKALVSELDHYTKISDITLNLFSGNSASLGQLCGKPFSITVLGIKK